MANDTIEMIRSAELNAAQNEKAAKEEAQKKVDQAKADAEALIKKATEEAKAKTKAALQENDARNAEIIAAAKEEAKTETGLLRELAAQHKDSAVDSAIRVILN